MHRLTGLWQSVTNPSIRHIYGVLTELLLVISDQVFQTTCAAGRRVLSWAERHDPCSLVDEVRELGHASRDAP